MAIWQLCGFISIGIAFVAHGDNPSLRGVPADQQGAGTNAVPSWCNNIPSSSWSEIPGCGGAVGGGGSVAGTPTWCSHIPAESLASVPACAQQQSVTTPVQLQASQLPVSPEINIPAVVPGVTPPVDVPSVDPNAIVDSVASGLQGAGATANLAAQANDFMPELARADETTMLASSSVPTWCKDIPSEGQQYIAACGGSGNAGSSQPSSPTRGGAPSWCNDMPASSRANVPSCVNNNLENGSFSSAPRLQSVTAMLATVAAVMAGTFL